MTKFHLPNLNGLKVFREPYIRESNFVSFRWHDSFENSSENVNPIFLIRLYRSSQTIFFGYALPYPVVSIFLWDPCEPPMPPFKKFPLVPYFGTPYTTLHRYCSHYKFIVFSFFAWFQSNQKYMLYHPYSFINFF